MAGDGKEEEMLRSKLGISGRLTMRKTARGFGAGLPWPGLPREVFMWRLRNCHRLFLPLAKVLLARLLRIPTIYGMLYLEVIRANGERIEYGLAGYRLVVDAGENFIVDAFQNIVELEIMKFHGIGTGATAPANADTALQTELTTQYNPDSTRATGSTTENGSATYRTVGTNAVDATVAITEFGLLSQAATGGGTLFERETFSVINLVSGDSLQTTYDCTFTGS